MRKKVIVFAFVLCIAVSALLMTACGGGGVTEEVAAVYTDEATGMTFTLFRVIGDGETYEYVKLTAYGGETETGSAVMKVTVPSEVTIEGTKHAVKTIGSLVFDHSKVSEIEIGEGIQIIEPFAFSYCEATVVTLPSTVTSIGEYAFVNCNSLRRLTIKAATPPSLGGYAFKYYMEKNNVYEPSPILKISVPKDSYDAYLSAWSEYGSNLAR